MGVAIREDGGTLGVFSPKKVEQSLDTNTDVNDLRFPIGGDTHHSSITSSFRMLSFSMRTLPVPSLFFFHLFTLLFCLSTLCYLLPSHTQLSHEITFDEQFDHFPTNKVCLIVVDFSRTRCNPVTELIN